MKDLLTRLSKSRYPYEPLVTVTISRQNLVNNLREFMKIAPQGRVAPVLKSNAYGHGLIEIASILEAERHNDGRQKKNQIPFFVIDSYFEAIALRSSGIRTPLLIIGYTRPEIIAKSRLRDVSFTVTSIDTLRHIANFQGSIFDLSSKYIPIHLKIDTGMHRQGILLEELDEVEHILDINPSIVIKGICSHLSDADNSDPSFTESQISRWNKIARKLSDAHASIEFVHISNTVGHRFVPEQFASLSRLGIGLYGLSDGTSFMPKLNLRPVMEMNTIISGIKKIGRDDTVGYGNTFKAEKDMVIATIPVGYYEGVDRRLSNIGTILVGSENIPCPIIGRVSMNITTIDVSGVPNVEVGMPVTVISSQSEAQNSILNIAKKCGTTTYDIAVHISGQLKRRVI